MSGTRANAGTDASDAQYSESRFDAARDAEYPRQQTDTGTGTGNHCDVAAIGPMEPRPDTGRQRYHQGQWKPEYIPH